MIKLHELEETEYGAFQMIFEEDNMLGHVYYHRETGCITLHSRVLGHTRSYDTIEGLVNDLVGLWVKHAHLEEAQ